MAELAMLADILWMVNPGVSNLSTALHGTGRESLPVKDQCSNHCATPLTPPFVVIMTTMKTQWLSKQRVLASTVTSMVPVQILN